jgi:hypothetical protein
MVSLVSHTCTLHWCLNRCSTYANGWIMLCSEWFHFTLPPTCTFHWCLNKVQHVFHIRNGFMFASFVYINFFKCVQSSDDAKPVEWSSEWFHLSPSYAQPHGCKNNGWSQLQLRNGFTRITHAHTSVIHCSWKWMEPTSEWFHLHLHVQRFKRAKITKIICVTSRTICRHSPTEVSS